MSNNSATSRSQKELYVAMILVLIVVFYALCNTIRCYFNLHELIYTIRGGMRFEKDESFDKYLFHKGERISDHLAPSQMILASLSHFLITFNSSINFAIYCIKVQYNKQ